MRHNRSIPFGVTSRVQCVRIVRLLIPSHAVPTAFGAAHASALRFRILVQQRRRFPLRLMAPCDRSFFPERCSGDHLKMREPDLHETAPRRPTSPNSSRRPAL